MRLIYYNDLIRNNELLFWIYVIIMIIIILLTIVFVRKELKNESK